MTTFSEDKKGSEDNRRDRGFAEKESLSEFLAKSSALYCRRAYRLFLKN